MFREIRRNKQKLSTEATVDILINGRFGVLGVSGDDGYPYTVPVSYLYENGKIFFHSAREGHKLDGIKQNEKVSFCVVDREQVVPEKFANLYRSAIIFGKAKIVADDATRQHALELFVRKYSPGYETEGAAEIAREWNKVCVVEIAIEHMAGKQAKGLV